MKGDIETGRLCRCGDCEDCHAYKLHMAEREARARLIKHTVVPLPKSNYVVVTDLSLLKGLNSSHKGGFYR